MNRLQMGAGILALWVAPGMGSLLRADGVRTIVSLDADWRFNKGEAAGAEGVGFEDGAWRKLNVPHDWAIEGPFEAGAASKGSGAFAPTGVVWYRKTLELPAGGAGAGKRVFVDFDGVMQNSEVWINGFHLGKRPYGYVSFQYELTGHLNAAGPNVLAVRADTSQQQASRWYNGGGIYRHVRLEVMDGVHLENWGTFVTTPKVAANAATVHVRSTVVNQSEAAREVTLAVNILGPEGKTVATGETTALSVPAGKSVDFDTDAVVNAPQLWDLENTQTYTAVATVKAGGAALDDQAVDFGIRSFEFKSDTGFWLNGKNIKLKGVCLHMDAGGLGIAVPEDEYIHRFQMLKSYGTNAIRTAHNPVSPEFLSACDKVGMLVMDEMFDCWEMGKNTHDYHLAFKDWSLIDTRDTVRRDRNHPSIILYSAGNEIREPNANLARAKEILGGLVRTFHENDPTRPVTQALFRPNGDPPAPNDPLKSAFNNGLADMLDVVGTNYRDAELQAAQRAAPTRKIVGTENNTNVAAWHAIRDDPGYSGSFIWTGSDYLGETFQFPSIGNSSGFLDITDRPKSNALERGMWWSDQPVVYVARAGAGGGGRGAVGAPAGGGPAADWSPANLAAHMENVSVYSNCEEVELFLNDKSLGSKPRGVPDSVRTWAVEFAPAGALRAVGKNKGAAGATHELKTAGAAAKVTLNAGATKMLFADFDSLACVHVAITDDKGVVVPTAANNVAFSITGPGEVAAVASGGAPRVQNFRGLEHTAFEGELMVYVRATGTGGPITLTASAEGLAKGTVSFAAAAGRLRK